MVYGCSLSDLADTGGVISSSGSRARAQSSLASLVKGSSNLEAVREETCGFLNGVSRLRLLAEEALVTDNSLHALLSPYFLYARFSPRIR